MTVVPQGGGGAVARGGGGGTASLYDVLELVLDRGLVIDVFARVSLVGIEILKVDARVVVASVDTYLRFAEACNRLDLEAGRKAPARLPEVVGELTEGGARGRSKGALTGAVEAFSESFRKGREEREGAEAREELPEPEHERERSGSARRASRRREE